MIKTASEFIFLLTAAVLSASQVGKLTGKNDTPRHELYHQFSADDNPVPLVGTLE